MAQEDTAPLWSNVLNQIQNQGLTDNADRYKTNFNVSGLPGTTGTTPVYVDLANNGGQVKQLITSNPKDPNSNLTYSAGSNGGISTGSYKHSAGNFLDQIMAASPYILGAAVVGGGVSGMFDPYSLVANPGASAAASTAATLPGAESFVSLPEGGMTATGGLSGSGMGLGSGFSTVGIPDTTLNTSLLGTGFSGAGMSTALPLGATLGGSIMAGAQGTSSIASGLGSAITNGINPANMGYVPGLENPNIGNTNVSSGNVSIPGAVSGIGSAINGRGNTNENTSGINLGNLAGSLYDMYAKNQVAGQLKPSLDFLSNMYAPGSPEANQMKKEMEARDAAAGRRSQYGERAVELAAKLAQARGNVLSSPGYLAMMGAYTNNNYGSLGSLFGSINSGKLFGGTDFLSSLYNNAKTGLNSITNNTNNNSTYSIPSDETPSVIPNINMNTDWIN